jgi:hypothetical protein
VGFSIRFISLRPLPILDVRTPWFPTNSQTRAAARSPAAAGVARIWNTPAGSRAAEAELYYTSLGQAGRRYGCEQEQLAGCNNLGGGKCAATCDWRGERDRALLALRGVGATGRDARGRGQVLACSEWRDMIV